MEKHSKNLMNLLKIANEKIKELEEKNQFLSMYFFAFFAKNAIFAIFFFSRIFRKKRLFFFRFFRKKCIFFSLSHFSQKTLIFFLAFFAKNANFFLAFFAKNAYFFLSHFSQKTLFYFLAIFAKNAIFFFRIFRKKHLFFIIRNKDLYFKEFYEEDYKTSISEEKEGFSAENSINSISEENNEKIAEICEKSLKKDLFLSESLKEITRLLKGKNRDFLRFFHIFMKKYEDLLEKSELLAESPIEKENFIANSAIFSKNTTNYDFLSQSIAEYFPLHEKNARFSHFFHFLS